MFLFLVLSSLGPRGMVAGLLGVCMVVVSVKPSPGLSPTISRCASPELPAVPAPN